MIQLKLHSEGAAGLIEAASIDAMVSNVRAGETAAVAAAAAEQEDPIFENSWVGSCFDFAPVKPGCVRAALLNTGTIGVNQFSRSATNATHMWNRFK